jgi:hypothetical protein
MHAYIYIVTPRSHIGKMIAYIGSEWFIKTLIGAKSYIAYLLGETELYK